MRYNWETRPLGELVKFSSGGTPSKKNPEYWNGNIPWISAKTMKDERLSTSDLMISAEGLAAGSKLAPVGSLLLLTRGSGLFNGIPLCIVEKPVAFNQDVKCIESCADVSNKFIFYWLKSQEEYLKAKLEVTGIGAGKFDTKFLQELNVPIPCKEDRDKIVSIAESISKKIIINTKINDNLQQQAYAYYLRLFVENGDPSWRVGTIADLGAVVGGGTPSKAKPEYYTEDGIAWITPKDLSIDKSKFIAHGENDISELGYRNSSATIMPVGTVLFSSRAPIGYIAIASNEVTTNQGFKSVVPHSQIGTPFVYYFLLHNLPLIESKASGSTFKEVSGSVMKSVEALIPDSDTIAKFNDFCRPVFAMQEKLEQENRKLAAMRDSLLPRLMSGEIDVADVDA
ncbi:MAG: restriction endonuclease subunit S [Oscillospiraceae bacterium]|nr:restriction endonuclease subunit S [Oscillospiraceae bacterium]